MPLPTGEAEIQPPAPSAGTETDSMKPPKDLDTIADVVLAYKPPEKL